MNAKTAKLLKQLEAIRERNEQIRQEIKCKEESIMSLKKQIANIK